MATQKLSLPRMVRENTQSSFPKFQYYFIFDEKRSLNFSFGFQGYGEDLGEKHNDVNFGTQDHNRKYYIQRHLLSMHDAIW